MTPSITYTCGFKEPPLYDMGQKAREIVASGKWERKEVREHPIPKGLFESILGLSQVTGFEKIKEEPISIGYGIHSPAYYKKEEFKEELFEELVFNIEDLVFSAAVQGFKKRCIKIVPGLVDSLRTRLATFFEERGLGLRLEWCGRNSSDNKCQIIVSWENELKKV